MEASIAAISGIQQIGGRILDILSKFKINRKTLEDLEICMHDLKNEFAPCLTNEPLRPLGSPS